MESYDKIKSEKPMNQDEDLEKEIERIVKCEKEFMNFKFKSQLIGYIARHFAQWGAERQKEQDDRLVDIIYQQGIEKGKDEMRKTLKRKEKK